MQEMEKTMFIRKEDRDTVSSTQETKEEEEYTEGLFQE